jgi:Mg-chelatase subunit ChlD
MPRHHLRWAVVLIVATLSVVAGLASAPSVSLRALPAEIAKDGKARVVVSVADATGAPVRGLSAANFRASVDGRDAGRLEVRTTAPAGGGIALALAIDVSGSMRAKSGLDTAAKAAAGLVDQLGPGDLCSLTVFGTGVRRLVDLTDDRARVKQALAGLGARDANTHLYEALFDALDQAATAPTPRAAVIAFTDGRDEGSPVGLQDVVAKATARDIPIYAVAFGVNVDTAGLRRMAAASHGAAYETLRPENAAAAYAAIAERLQTDYALTFSVPPGTSPSQIAVTVRHRGELAGVMASAGTAARPAGAPGTTSARTDAAAPVPASAPAPASSWPPLIVGLVAVSFIAIAATVAVTWRGRRRETAAVEDSDDPPMTVVASRVWLEVTKGPDNGLKLPLFAKATTVGRDPKCQFPLKNDPMVGRQHTRLTQTDLGHYVIEDLGSQNGVTVNGVRISQPITLQSDDRIGLGVSELVFIDRR